MPKTISRLLAPLLASLAMCACAAPPSPPAPPAPYAGADVSGSVDAADIGLPLYPGARLVAPHDGGDRPALNLSIWGGSLGFRLAVVKLHSDAPMADVAAFYRRAMARRGPWRDCSRPDEGAGPTCDRGDTPAGGHLFKAGDEDKEVRTVSLSPQDGGVRIQLVRAAFGREAALR
jgi:hypothetical protein